MRKYPHIDAIIRKKLRPKFIKVMLLLFLAVGGISGSFFLFGQKEAEPVPLYEVSRNNQKCYVDVTWATDYFAALTDGTHDQYRYYFIGDVNQLYVAILKDETVSSTKMQRILNYVYSSEQTESPVPVRIEGVSRSLNGDVKKYAIETLQVIFGENITKEDFEDIVYPIMLDETGEPNNFSTLFGVVGGVSAIFLISAAINYLSAKSKNTKGLFKIPKEMLEKIDADLVSEKTFSVEGIDIFLTKEYIVDLTEYFEAINYDDIYWIYTVPASIMVGTNKKEIPIGFVPASKNEKKKILIEELAKRCPKAMVGYTEENLRQYKEIKKNKLSV